MLTVCRFRSVKEKWGLKKFTENLLHQSVTGNKIAMTTATFRFVVEKALITMGSTFLEDSFHFIKCLSRRERDECTFLFAGTFFIIIKKLVYDSLNCLD